ncbi:uncharacterized protein TRIADDRAFT_19587 [Trichoplax adhaerens]|uniref:Uncharacterized protein n=1 Tax=Trichoplax adhaerens TaxID=10228 RepID=B3RIC2_TRIAD|nr:hypothetical protein TRIADDRAFT_19587 [Trichoplax adhaerens]EDV29726.1 hypothetical protein TRIADDRAFT_19587 [Trichoplax adhaerens]|eukprot:XP_002108928.1 hypothetical protein TRIADDRAFT_19587 [Trichoplax adhaerens]
MSDQELYCICNGPYHDNEFMIQCDVCNDWFHGRCIGIEEYEASRIDTYHCPKCSDLFGPLTCKKDFSYENSHNLLAIQNGNVSFVKQLDDRNFSCGEEIILNLTGADLSPNFLESEGFRRPILVKNKSDLDITVPPATFTVADVERYVGSMRNLDVIDVARQAHINMKMREWTEYYNSSDRKRVLNVISLEFSDTRLSDLIEAPAIVRHIDLLKHVWPKFSSETGPFRRPQVKKYCLMSVKASYTDFHIDFGGSSVWYHVLKGEKVFYLIEPTPENLITYEQWVSSKLQNEVFLGDEMQCYKCRIRQGETLFIPTGWIHAVYTPTDSLVFGGNFLHFLNMELQLKVYDLEIRLNTPEKFLFPFFETCIWYSGRYLVDLRGGDSESNLKYH